MYTKYTESGVRMTLTSTPRLRPTELAESIGHRFLDSFAELCECRDNQLEGLYSGRWYRVAATGVDGAGAHLLYLDTDETELLRPADFERGSWRVRGGARAGKGADAAGGARAGLAARPRQGLPRPGLRRRPGAHPRPAPPRAPACAAISLSRVK